jgi:hypothetical protein
MRGGMQCCLSDIRRVVQLLFGDGPTRSLRNCATISPVRWAMWCCSHFFGVVVDHSGSEPMTSGASAGGTGLPTP